MAENQPTQNPDEPPVPIEVPSPSGPPAEPKPPESSRPQPPTFSGRRPLFGH